MPKEQGLTPGVGIQEAEPVGVDDGDNGASADDGDQGSTPDNDKAAGDKDKDKSKDKDKDRIGRGGGNPAADPRGGDGDGNGGDGALGGSVECNQREEPDPDCPADGALDDDTNGKSKNTTGRRARKAGLKNRQAAGKEIGKRAGKHPSRHGG